MKTLTLFILSLALISDLSAANLAGLLGGSPPAPAIAPSFAFSDELTYADTTAASAASWNTTGSGVWGRTASPAPLNGKARSLCVNWGDYVSHDLPEEMSECWIKFSANAITVGQASPVFFLKDSSGTNLVRLTFRPDGGVETLNLNITAGESVTQTIGTTYDYVLHYRAGTPALVEMYRAANGGAKGTVLQTVSWVNSATSAHSIVFGADNNANVVFQSVVVAATDIF